MKFLIVLLLPLLISACKHPLAIQGEGDIIEVLTGIRGCSLEEFNASSPKCTENEVSGEAYTVRYEGVPRPGWQFFRWAGGTGCSPDSTPPYCEYNVTQDWIEFTDETWPGTEFPATVAVFEPISSNSITSGYYQGLTMPYDGRTRVYDLYVPSSYDGSSRVPLLVDAHGANQTSNSQKGRSGFDIVADRENFIVVYPVGTNRHWNIDVCCSPATDENVDDSGFIKALVAKIKAEAIIDSRRVYATGWSAGGGIAARAICDAADVFAAAAVFASMTQIGEICQPSRSIPIMSLHATDDSIVPFDGGSFFGQAPVLSQQEILDFFFETNSCSTPATVNSLGPSTQCDIYNSCAGGAETALCATKSNAFNGHDVYQNVDGVNLAEVAWDFLTKFELP